MNIAGQERPVGQLATRKPKPFSNLTHHFVKASKITGLVPTDVLVAVFFACFRQDTLVLCPHFSFAHPGVFQRHGQVLPEYEPPEITKERGVLIMVSQTQRQFVGVDSAYSE